MSGKIIAVCGGDGVGKSTISTNLAVALSDDHLVIVFGARTDYPSIQSFFDTKIPDEKGIAKLYENISLDVPVEIKDYLVQYKSSNIFLLSAADTLTALSLADGKLTPTKQQCSNILLMLQSMCDYLIIDCDTDINNVMSAWSLNAADVVLNVVKPTQQGLRFSDAYQEYYKSVWRGKVINVANADKNYIGAKNFESLTGIKFGAVLPYEEQLERSENTGVPMLQNYLGRMFWRNDFLYEFWGLVDLVLNKLSE